MTDSRARLDLSTLDRDYAIRPEGREAVDTARRKLRHYELPPLGIPASAMSLLAAVLLLALDLDVAALVAAILAALIGGISLSFGLWMERARRVVLDNTYPLADIRRIVDVDLTQVPAESLWEACGRARSHRMMSMGRDDLLRLHKRTEQQQADLEKFEREIRDAADRVVELCGL